MSEIKIWCETCGGKGYVTYPPSHNNRVVCPDCDGNGYTVQTLYTRADLAKAWDEGFVIGRSKRRASENPYREDDDGMA